MGGVSNARNIGIDKSNGKYLTFVDSDDWVEESYISTLINHVNKEIDFVVTGFFGDIYINNYLYKTTCSSVSEIRTNMITKIANDYSYAFNTSRLLLQTVWCKLYKTNIIKDNKLYFRNDLVCYEDFLYNLDYLQYINKYIFIPSLTYHYVNDNYGSAILRRNKDDLVMEIDCIYEAIENLKNKIDLTDTFNKEVDEYLLEAYNVPIVKMCSLKNKSNKYAVLDHLMNSKGFKQVSTSSRKYRLCNLLYKVKLKKLCILILSLKK